MNAPFSVPTVKLPENTEVEQGVLGALMAWPEKLEPILAACCPDDFYNATNAAIAGAIVTLHVDNIPVTPLTVATKLAKCRRPRPRSASTCSGTRCSARTGHLGGRVVAATTGVNLLDEAIGGLQGGDLVVYAGRPGMGKSALLMSTALRAAMEGQAGDRLLAGNDPGAPAAADRLRPGL
jgi:replicative DNA helicase